MKGLMLYPCTDSDDKEYAMPAEQGVQGRSSEMERRRPDMSRLQDIPEELSESEGLTFRKRI